MKVALLSTSLVMALFLSASGSGDESLDARIDKALPAFIELYKTLHANPELSFQERQTAKLIAARLRSLGYTVTEGVGRFAGPIREPLGVVALMKNGEGPTLLIRTDMDALPMVEKTGLPYRSTKKAINAKGAETGVMHSCGHDIHMVSFLGTASMLSEMKSQWKGTLLLVGQQAEEMGAGARALLDDGLYTRFGRPDFVLALHDDPHLEAGMVGLREGYLLASVDSVDITIFGVGGHGAYPNDTKDPIVIAAQVVLALQTIVSREISPLDPAVVTVGSIHGGTKHNIIPDEVRLQLTVRAYKKEVRQKILSAIERIARETARAAGVPEERMPTVALSADEHTPATYNDPALTRRLAARWTSLLGAGNVVTAERRMAGEDFSRYSLDDHSIPTCLFWLGAADPAKIAASRRSGIGLPGLHSPFFAPPPEPTIRTGIKAMTAAALDLLGG